MTLEDYNRYDEGEVVTISMEFRNKAGELTSPTSLLIQFRNPETREITERTEADVDVFEDEEGKWHLDVNTLGYAEGVWFYKVYAQGDSASAKEWAFIIKTSELA